MAKAKNGKAVDVRKAAADKLTRTEQHYKVVTTQPEKFRGFLGEFVKFANKKDSVTTTQLIAEFNGRQIDGHKVSPQRVKRYISYCVSHDIFKTPKMAS
jgi:hypothetical protein